MHIRLTREKMLCLILRRATNPFGFMWGRTCGVKICQIKSVTCSGDHIHEAAKSSFFLLFGTVCLVWCSVWPQGDVSSEKLVVSVCRALVFSDTGSKITLFNRKYQTFHLLCVFPLKNFTDYLLCFHFRKFTWISDTCSKLLKKIIFQLFHQLFCLLIGSHAGGRSLLDNPTSK